MLELELCDRNGTKLNEGDIVKISNGSGFTFISEVKYLKEEQIIAPFDTFSFHSFVKIDKLPDNVIQSTEERYKIWWYNNPEIDTNPEYGEKYLINWRACEHLIEQRCFKIKPLNK
jgi:hypothetical protein